jgi:hypothetical protein
MLCQECGMEGRWWRSESGALRDIQAARKLSERTLTGCDAYDDSDGTTELATLRAENARLRELVRSAYSEGWQDGRTDDPYDTATGAWDRSAARVALVANEPDDE